MTFERFDHHVMDDSSRIAVVHHWVQDDRLREVDSGSDLGKNKLRFQYGNHLGSASLELDESGQVISYEEYFPFGGSSFMVGRSAKEVKLKEYRFTGKERDDFTGLYYFGARYYAPWVGRWMSADPKRENNDGLNLYAYCRNNPVGLVDPNGNQSRALYELNPRQLMMTSLATFFGALSDFTFGFNSDVNTGRVETPQGGVGGLIGGGLRAASFRLIPFQKNPSMLGIAGAETGASFIPFLNPIQKMATGTSVANQETSRRWAAIELAIDAAVFMTIKPKAKLSSKSLSNGSTPTLSGDDFTATHIFDYLDDVQRAGKTTSYNNLVKTGDIVTPGFVPKSKIPQSKIPPVKKGYFLRQNKADDPGLPELVEELKAEGIEVENINMNVFSIDDFKMSQACGEYDIITSNAIIQYKDGKSSAFDVIDQLEKKTIPFTDRKCISFINNQHKKGNSTVGKIRYKGYNATNNFQELIKFLKN